MNLALLRDVYGTDFISGAVWRAGTRVTLCDRCRRPIANGSLYAMVVSFAELEAYHARCARGWAPLRRRSDVDALRPRMRRLLARRMRHGRERRERLRAAPVSRPVPGSPTDESG